jgi:hypothetical protein
MPATVSSTPSGGRVCSPLTTMPISDSMSHDAGRSSRTSPSDWARSTSPRSGEATRRSNSAESGRALSRHDDERVADADQGAHRALERLRHRDLVQPARLEPLARLLDRDPPQGLEQRLPVGEVAIHGGAGHAGRRRDIGHARLLAALDEHRCRRLQDRGAHPSMQCCLPSRH